MKTTIRRIKALEGKGKYARIVDKIIVYDESGKQIDCRKIEKDEDGKEYYNISNPKGKLKLFTNYPKDAIDCIREDLGDVLVSINGIFNFSFSRVRRYIDREYGKQLRQKTLEGWKDTKFGYAIKFGYTDSLFDGSLINEKKELHTYFDKSKILIFDSYNKAKKFVDEILTTGKKYLKEYKVFKNSFEDPKYEDLEPFYEKVKNEIGADSIYYEVFFGLLDNDEKGKDTFYIKIVQYPIM